MADISISDISAEDLLPLIKPRRVIWDKNYNNFKHKALRAAAWREICAALNPEFDTLDENDKKDFVKTVSTKWIHIRDAYLRSQKTLKRKINKVGIVKKPKPYVYENLLNFLKTDEPRSRQDSCNESQSSSSNSSDIEAALHGPTSTTKSRNQASQRVIYKEEEEEEEEAEPEIQFHLTPAKTLKVDQMTLEEKLTRFLDAKSSYQQENPHISFMKGILPSLSTFDDDENLEFQAGVLALIQKIRRNRHRYGERSDDVKVVFEA